MPRKYQRSTLRASWASEDLEKAMEKVRNKVMGVNEASRTFKIPSRTLRRHLLSGKLKVPLGRNPVFSIEHEKKIVAHIKKLEQVGFAPERKDVKEMAFQIAKKLEIKNPFLESSASAGNTWFMGFMKRNPELSTRQSEGLSLARAYGVNREDVKYFFDLLTKLYEKNDFANHPEDIYNMDESGIQVNNKAGKVVATKGARDVFTLTSCEKGENVTVIACCNAQGNFIPPVLIYKGTYSKPQFSEGLPPGSQVFMNKKSSYINSDLFMKWFEEVFLRHKSQRKTLLVLDGHSSHSNNIRLLEVAKENNVILLCLPSHTTHALQPLDRAFFRPLKMYFAQEARAWMVRNKDKKLTRYDVSKLIGGAWGKAATIRNGVSALKSCGIYPFNPSAIPEHYFSLSDSLREQDLVENAQNDEDDTSTESMSLLVGPSATLPDLPIASQQINLELEAETSKQHRSEYVLMTTASTPTSPSEQGSGNILVTTATIHSPLRCRVPELEANFEEQTANKNKSDDSTSAIHSPIQIMTLSPATPKKCPQKRPTEPHSIELNDMDLIEQIIPEKTVTADSKDTPSKILSEIHPVPKLPFVLSKKKQKAVILTSDEHIQKRKLIADKKKQKVEAGKLRQNTSARKRKALTTRKKEPKHALREKKITLSAVCSRAEPNFHK
ncbi:uncharacterized protein LOC113232741 [Hyposmocoma kahamanoa]|uniref:uncharacterized protein LOC113232741 n=1 Tax=Hyposmocoma kahamanoa TaxID=1477025 RepID=UPI000E6D9FC1|nr:uncharacterized protein LOC113232741 [Hyposmocoma kahamanoa]